MFGGGRKKSLVALAWGLAAAALLAGCAGTEGGPSAGAVGTVTLAQSKSYAQLLRNEASSRLPAIVLKEVAQSSDVSVACDEASDPQGLSRSWSSSTIILVTNSTAARIQTVAEDLIASFAKQGWTAGAESDSTDTLTVTRLTNKTSLASMEVEAASKAEGQAPSIRITATGVCALTGGPESDEVTMLEGKDAPTAG